MPIHGIRTVYQPFSLQERMAPLSMMKEEYDKVNEGLAELGMTANQVAQYIDPNSKAGQTLAQYNNTLNAAADTLSREGLKGLSRTELYNLKRAYQSQIAPINEGAKNYFSLQEKIKEMQWKDPTIMVSGMPTLDEYIQNPNALPNLVSGAQLQQEGIKAVLQLPGIDYDTISRYMNGDMSAIPDLNAAAQRIADNYGVSTEQAMGYITNGIMSGLGQRATDIYNTEQKLKMEEASKLRVLNAQAGKEAYLAKIRHGYTMSEIEARNAGKLAGKSGSGSSRGSGTQYNRQMDGTVYVRGDQEYAYNGSFGNAQKDAGEKAESGSKARGTSVYRLSPENKARALRYIGVDIPDDITPDELDMLIEENESALLDYTYKEYIDPKRTKDNEFKMSPKKIKRDVGVPEYEYDESEDWLAE